MDTTILAEFGVQEDTLSKAEKLFLAENGYLNLGQLLTENQLLAIRKKIDQLLNLEGENAGVELFDSPHIKHPKEEGATRLADLVNKGPIFDIFYTHPKMLAAIVEVIGINLKLSSLNYRAALPGKGLQKLHVDWKEAVSPGDFKVCNSIWLLDDFTGLNGATRIVPGTHLSGTLPNEEMDNPFDTHPNEILIEAPAGSVVIFNSHTWHGGTTNLTDHPRRAIHSYFCRRDQPQQLDQKRFIKQTTLDRISAAAQMILDV